MPRLPTQPTEFIPTGRYTAERKEIIDKAHPGDFLWPEERKLMHNFMMLHEKAFAWDESEKGRFRTDFFPPVEMAVLPHTPWILKNIPIPPGIYKEVCKIIQDKIDSGAYEPSNASYRSRWFCVLKKNGKDLRIVHSLEPLNAVTIQQSGVTPFTEEIAEQFAGLSCYGMHDMFVGYDERTLSSRSRDLTTFQTPFGAMRLTSLPMGWCNSVAVFHEDVVHMLREEIPEYTVPYIDDIPIKGPRTRYETDSGGYQTIPENKGIRRFVWEHFQNQNRICTRLAYCGATLSGKKAYLCVPEALIVGHKCTHEGCIPDDSSLDKIRNWGRCWDVSDVRSFLGTIGVCRAFIQNYAHRAAPFVERARRSP